MAAMSAQIDHHLGTPLSPNSCESALLLGSGELGREIAIALMRLGVRVCAADSYPGAPAAQVAHEAKVIDMTDADALEALISAVKPDIIIPEVEAIATQELTKAARHGVQVVPSSRIAAICMNRELLRLLAHEELGLPTTDYRFAGSLEELRQAANRVGYPCVVKPIMSSSGRGQSIVNGQDGIQAAWFEAQEGRRSVGASKSGGSQTGASILVIVESLAPLDYELTVLTVSSSAGVATCQPIGQRQDGGDYQESWQPAAIPSSVLDTARDMAKRAVQGLVELAQANDELGWGVFGVELFVLADGRVLFNEVSPRPHDTGMVTMISQRIDEFTLHARAILGAPITPEHLNLAIPDGSVAASHAVVVHGDGEVNFDGLFEALGAPDTDLRIFDKPSVHGARRMAVTLAIGNSVEDARMRAAQVATNLDIDVKTAQISPWAQ